MRKKRIVQMYNDAVSDLHSIKTNLIKHIESKGAEWVDHGTDDNDRTCFKLNDRYFGISTRHWDVDGELVSLARFLKEVHC